MFSWQALAKTLKKYLNKIIPGLCLAGTVVSHVVISEYKSTNNINQIILSEKKVPDARNYRKYTEDQSDNPQNMQQAIKQYLLNISNKNIWLEDEIMNLPDNKLDNLVNKTAFRKIYEQTERNNYFINDIVSKFCRRADRIAKTKNTTSTTNNEKYFCGRKRAYKSPKVASKRKKK